MNENDQGNFPFRKPPNKEDILFPSRSSGGTEINIFSTLGDEWIYINSFRQSAVHLSRDFVCPSENDYFTIYPIIYLYRHHFELSLKYILKISMRILDIELSKNDIKIMNTHSIRDIWQEAKKYLGPVCQLANEMPFSDYELEWVNSYINQIHEQDPNGQRFRYSTVKIRGEVPNEQSINHSLKYESIDIIAMENLSEFLQRIAEWFEMLEEIKTELSR